MEIEKVLKEVEFANQYQKLIVNIIFTGNWVQSGNAKFLKQFNLTPQQFNVLKILNSKHPQTVSISSIAERMLDPTSNASRLVEKLRQKNYIRRKISSTDRRQAEVMLTDKGKELIKEVEDKFKLLEKNLNSITAEEAETLNKLLDKLRQ